jgi:hypothetical protein
MGDYTFNNEYNTYALNLNEIYQYKQKRQIKIINNNNKLLDNNFTFITSFHAISPFSFEKYTDNHIKSNNIIAPNEFIDTNTEFYKNLDAFK